MGAVVAGEAGRYQRLLFVLSFGTYLFGFLCLWIPENALCPLFPATVQYLHLHAWFHLTGTVAPYNLLVFLTFHRLQVRVSPPARPLARGRGRDRLLRRRSWQCSGLPPPPG